MTETLPAVTTGDDPPHMGGLARGASVGRYLIVDCVGRGGMGVVYRAFDPDLDRAIAIKLVRADSRNPERRQRLRARLVREAKTLAQLSHPNVVAVYDVGPFEDGAFVAMELIDGDTLRGVLAKQPSAARVIELFAGAGRGLAAAHAIGIVHRDFKPDNVIVGSDGTARVLDFGLARAIDGSDDAMPGSSGTIAGTPGYMAPEQMAGADVDERTDQYSFCVALHEGLFGTVPEPDPTTIPSRTRAGVRVPARLRDAIRRGLSGARTARHASMPDLLDALALSSPRRRVAWIGGLAAVIAAAGIVVATRGDGATSCEVSESRLTGTWDPVRKAAVRDALRRHGDDATADTVERSLDRYVASWREMSASSCRATRAGEQSGELLDLRAECLDHRLAELRELTTLLAGADAATAGHAVESVRGLSPVDDCANATVLRDAIPPRDPVRARELRDQLAHEHARFVVAGYAEVVAATPHLAELAASAGDGWLVASTQFLQARASRELGRIDDAEDQLYRAVATAESARASDIAVRAWTSLAWVVGEDRHRPADGLRLALVARGALDRIGGSTRLEAPLEDDIGMLELDRDHVDDARVHAQRAVELGRKAFGEDSEYAIYLQHLAMVEARSGHRDAALELYRRAHRIAEAELGARHPTVLAIAGAEGVVLGELDRAADEIALLEPALAHADPSSDVAASLLVNLGLAYWKSGKLDRAKAADLRGLAIARDHDPNSARTASLELDLALVLLDRGELADAHSHAVAAVAALDTSGADPRSVAEALQVSAQCDLRTGHAADAAPALDRELAILVGAKAPANDIAATRFDLAKAALARRDPTRARSLAETARDELHEAGDADGVREVTAWLQRL